MLAVNDVINVEVTNFASGGEGIARHDDFVVFIPYAATYDKLSVRIKEVKKNFARAKIVKILSPSKHRTKVLCPYYYNYTKNTELFCGGCNFLHLNIEHQHQAKKDFVINSLNRIGKVHDFVWDGMKKSKLDFNYRNKVKLPLGYEKKNIIMGFYAPKSHSLVSIQKCLLENKNIEGLNEFIIKLLTKYKISIYNEQSRIGLLRHIIIRTNSKDEIMLIFVVTKEIKSFDRFLDDLLKCEYKIVSVYINLNNKNTNVVLGNKSIKKHGVSFLRENIGDIVYRILPTSFFQVNSYAAFELYETIKDYLHMSIHDTVLDLYCGSGGSGLYIAKYVGKVIGIEESNSSIKSAKQNAILNNIQNTNYFCAHVEDLSISKNMMKNIDKNNLKVIINPPRKGIKEEVISLLDKLQPCRIVYSSCNPVTLARDLKLIQDLGYKVKRISNVDMFPQTSHVETVAEIIKGR